MQQPATTGPSGGWVLAAVVVLLLCVVGAVLVAGARVGVLVLVGVMALAGLLRLMLPTGRAGPLAVRSRALDVVTCWVLAAGLLVLLRLVPTP